MILRCFLCLLFFITLNADVKLFAPESFIQNEPFIFELQASGEEITFPSIDSIDGFVVQNAGTSNQITIVNGSKSKIINKKYLLYPTKDFTLPPFSITIDGKSYLTASKNIAQVQAKKTQNTQFDFKIIANKKSVYVNEPIVVDYIFKYKKDDNILELGLESLTFEHFWAKKIGDGEIVQDATHTTQKLRYILFPQQSGKLNLKPARVVATLMDVGASYSFFQRPTKREIIYSNSLEFDVKPLPNAVNIVGDFTVTESLDKTKVNAGEAVTFTITIKGNGNLEDLSDIKLDIPNATIYSNDAQNSFSFENGKFTSEYKKSFSIVANDSFTISSVKIPYFLVNKKSVEYLNTKSYDVEVVASTATLPKPILEKSVESSVVAEVQQQTNSQYVWFYFLAGVVFTLGLGGLFLLFKNRTQQKEKETPLVKVVKKAPNAKELIKVLVPYVNKDQALDTIIFELEKNSDLDIKLKKKEIIKILKSNF